MGLVFYLVISVIGLVSAVGFHYANEILPGTFSGDYTFDGNVSVTGSINASYPLEPNDVATKQYVDDKDIALNLTNCQWTGYVNNYDQAVNYVCPDNKVLTGEISIHMNHYEDRRFRYRCCSISLS